MIQKSRRARIWRERQVPRWRDFLIGGSHRRAALSYWQQEGILNLLDKVLFKCLGLLPPRWAGNFGAFVTDVIVRPTVPQLAAMVRHNVRRIRPELAHAEIEHLVRDYYRNKGRLFGEFPVLEKLNKAGKISVVGADALITNQSKRNGSIILGLHLANWEIGIAAIANLGLKMKTVYAPPNRSGQHRLAVQVREAIGGQLFPPGQVGARPMVRDLRAGGVIALQCDEGVDGIAMAPLFERPTHANGNLAIAARLSRMSGATIFVAFCTRDRDDCYVMHIVHAVQLNSHDRRCSLLEDVETLNALIEPIIRARCSEWFFLDHQIDVVDLSS